eukprot:scaffold3545_cov126-Isochrysis_galbana.AAC.3
MPVAVVLALHLAVTGRIGRPLSTLAPGEALKGTIVHRHEELLYLKVDVEDDTGKRAAPVVDAMLKLPQKHPLLKEPRIGAELTVYVKGVTGGARLRVGLYPRRPPPRTPPDSGFLKLDELKPGDSLEGVVVATAACGVFVDAGIWRRGPRARWLPVEALLPPDQQMVGDNGSISSVEKGAVVLGRVLDSNVASGKLLMTTRDEPMEDLVADLRERRRFAKARQRRLSSGKLKVGTEREGVVVRVEPYGLVVNVGAKQTGLAHISNLGPGIIEDVGDYASVGDVVLVQVLAAAQPGDKGFRGKDKLRLKFVRKLVRMADQVPSSLLATARRGQVLQQRFERLEDGRLERRAERAAAATSAAPSAAASVAVGVAAAVQRGVGEDSRAVEGLAMVEERLEDLNQELEDEDEDDIEESKWDADYFADKYEDDFY